MKLFSLFALSISLVGGLVGVAGAQQAAEVPLDKARQIPPPGVAIPQAAHDELEAGAAELKQQIEFIRASPIEVEVAPGIASPVLVKAATLLPDVEIFYNAVHYALTYNEFFNVNEVDKAKALLTEGTDRAASLKEGQAPWIHAPGLIVRGYVSKIDGSVQPYGLVIPGSFATNPSARRRLDIWYHGRGETLNEINFLSDRRKSVGEFPPDDDTIVVHPYGRYCNGNRFAGEVDTFEVLESVKKNYPIDSNRIVVRGFSMGGAACWMMATHHAGDWCAAAPGAGYTETAGFLKITDLSTVPWYQQKLWHLYDSTDYALNLYNCPTVAYSGELDGQKQAADMMDKALAGVGIDLVQVIGPKAHHHYTPAAKVEISRRIDAIAAVGRPTFANSVNLVTWSLRYNRMKWVRLDAMEHSWERAVVSARVVDATTLRVQTQNATALTFDVDAGHCPLDEAVVPKITIDDQDVAGPRVLSDKSWTAHFIKSNGKWALGELPANELRKKHGLQGPIDDAFMDSFVIVHPTGKPFNDKTGAWAASEQTHAIDHWRKQFRGEAQVKDDTDIADADIAHSNLILFGDASSNAIIAKIIDRLPIKWDAQSLTLGKETYPSATHMPVLIYPNPLNPEKYVVLNSGFTYREYDYENNARQTPKLPDWAIVNTEVAPTAQTPGQIKDAGFFGEKWEVVGH